MKKSTNTSQEEIRFNRKIRGVYLNGSEKIFLATCIGDPVWHIMKMLIPEVNTPNDYWKIAWESTEFPVGLRDETDQDLLVKYEIASKQRKRNNGARLHDESRISSRRGMRRTKTE